MDCLRADHVGFLGYSRPVTPFLDALAKNSVVFSDAIVAGAPTYFSFPAIMASRYPLALGRDILGIAPHEFTSGDDIAGRWVYDGRLSRGQSLPRTRFGYDQGFAIFRDFLDSASAAFAPSCTEACVESQSSHTSQFRTHSADRGHIRGTLFLVLSLALAA